MSSPSFSGSCGYSSFAHTVLGTAATSQLVREAIMPSEYSFTAWWNAFCQAKIFFRSMPCMLQGSAEIRLRKAAPFR